MPEPAVLPAVDTIPKPAFAPGSVSPTAAPPEPAPKETQTGTQPAVPAAETAKPQEAPKPPEAKKDIFTVTIGDEKKEFDADGLVGFTDEKIGQALEVHDRAVGMIEKMAEKPLLAAMDIMAARKFGGDRDKAYEFLIALCVQAVKEDGEYQKRPEAERRALALEEKNKELAERLRREENTRNEQERNERLLIRRAEIAKELKEAIEKSGLSNTKEVVGRMVLTMQARRRQGEDPNFMEIAQELKEELNGSVSTAKEEYLKTASAEEILRLRPDLIDKAPQTLIEEIRKAREAQAPKPKPEPYGPDFLPKRTPISRLFSS